MTMSTIEKIDWQVEQERFMTLAYTRCERAARRAFKKWHDRKKGDAVQEALGKMWHQWRCCLEKGKEPAEMIGPLIHWAIMFVRYDRRIARRSGCIDVYDYRSNMVRHLMDGRGQPEPHDRADRINSFLDWTGQARTDDPGDLAAALERAEMTLEQYLAA
jgi:hypothetical protein